MISQIAIEKAIEMIVNKIKVEDPTMFEALRKVGIVNEKVDKKEQVQNQLPPTMIFEYVEERRKRVGIILGLIQDKTIKIGWAKTNLKAGDRFDKDEGLSLAEARAIKMSASPALPPCMKRQMVDFTARCYRYFKDADKMELVR